MQRESTDHRRSPGNEFPEIHRYHESRSGGTDHQQEGRAPTAEAGAGSDARAEARNAIRAKTIGEIENLEHFPSEQELSGYMELRLVYKRANSYLYWVEDLPSAEDRRDLEPAALADFYGGLADFISSRAALVDVSSGLRSPQEMDLLRGCLGDYSSRITQKAENFRELVSGGGYPSQQDFEKNFVFNGLNIKVGDKVRDLCHGLGWSGDLMSNIDVRPLFVSYWTEAMAHQKVVFAGKTLPLHYRIYLNPELSRTLEIAGRLSDAFEHENLHVMHEIMNRPYNVAQYRGRIGGVRTEGITVYCNRYHANRALEIILECFEDNYDFFKDRPTPKLATPVAPGVAVASHEGFETMGYSFDSHRSNIITDAWEDFASQNGGMAMTVSHQSIHAFRQVLETEFRKHRINPRNIAFRDSSASGDIL
ncbi:hypothetical protein F4X86_03450 [Candidatus Saccharibacteria bacterium]|nr:hypothetical protein [Candidatus Saccharibacteria bacterium]